jgi:hypothetical protein
MAVDAPANASAEIARAAAGSDQGILMHLLERSRECLSSFSGPELAHYLRRWPRSIASDPPVARSLPVVRILEDSIGAAPAFSDRLLAALRGAAHLLNWRQTYPAQEMDVHFSHNYGWTELVGPRGLVPGTEISCGILLLGARTLYPRHVHEAEEIYLPLLGRAYWQRGDEAWALRPAGALIHHARDIPHAMRTDQEPLIALYLWRSSDLSQSARMDPLMVATSGRHPE